MPSDTYYFRTVVFVYLAAAAAATGAASLLVMGCGIHIIVRFGSLYTENKYYQTLLYCNLCIITCFIEFYTVVMLLKLQKLLQKLDGTECTRSPLSPIKVGRTRPTGPTGWSRQCLTAGVLVILHMNALNNVNENKQTKT